MRLTSAGLAWVDGVLQPLEEVGVRLDDPAFIAGLGAFETLAVRGGQALELDEHLARLTETAVRLSLQLPPGERLREGLLAIAARQTVTHGWLRVVATRSGRVAAFGGPMDPAEEGRPSSAVLLPWRRSIRDPLAGLKTLNYAANTLGLEEAARRGADEGLWRNERGHLAEGCASNLFVVRRGALYTPGLGEGILPGVVRGLALAAARTLSMRVHEGRVRVKRLERADEMFLTSSLRAVRPLIAYEGRAVGDGQPGPVTRAIAKTVAAMRRPAPPVGEGS